MGHHVSTAEKRAKDRNALDIFLKVQNQAKKLNPSKNNMLHLERTCQKENLSFPLLKVKDDHD